VIKLVSITNRKMNFKVPHSVVLSDY